MGDNVFMDDDIIQKVGTIMTKQAQNQRLQELAKNNGLDVKNTLLSTVALMLAKRSQDSDYDALVRAGMQHRKLKTELINKYKDQANQWIERYKSSIRDDLASV